MKLSSGRSISEINDRVGLDVDAKEITYGYDGGIWRKPTGDEFEDGHIPYPDLTKEELIEIADIMIHRWEKFKMQL